MKPGKIKTNILVLITSCVLSFGIAEVITRLFYPAPQIMTIRNAVDATVSQQSSQANPPMRFFIPHVPAYTMTDGGRRLRPNTEIIIENHKVSQQKISLRTNALGYRNREIGPKTGTRLLFLGDSITFADYLPEEDTFVRQIETHARREHRDWETVNAGVGAISLKDELSILLETGLSIQPDVVVLNLYLNDFQESPGIYNPLPGFLRHSYFLYHLTNLGSAVISLRRSKSSRTQEQEAVESWKHEFEQITVLEEGDFRQNQNAFHTLIVENFTDWGGAWSEHAWEYMEPLLHEFQRLAQEHSFTLCIVMHPVRFQVETSFVDDFPQRQLQEIADELGVPVLDVLPILRSVPTAKRDELFYDQCHHTLYGSQIVTQAIYTFLQDVVE